YADKPLEKPLKLVLKVGGSEVTELSGSGHDSSYYDDRSDHERERHKEKKKKKKKKSEKEKHLDDEERRKRKEEKKRKREKEHCDTEGEADDFDPGKKVEVEPPPDRPVRACRTQPGKKDPHGFFAFPVTDAIAPGYSMIIKHPMDFGTMKDKIVANEYKSVTEFKADFKLMCDNAMTYNRPDTVYYKLAKKILHAGFKMMSKERLLALKRSMSFMQDMDFSQQAALLGNEDTAVEEPVPEVVPVQVETAKKSKRPSREVISCMFEPEGNACSLTDSTAEEHHAADEARDRISRLLPGGKVAPPTGWLCFCRDSGTAVTGERSAGHYERAALLSPEGRTQMVGGSHALSSPLSRPVTLHLTACQTCPFSLVTTLWGSAAGGDPPGPQPSPPHTVVHSPSRPTWRAVALRESLSCGGMSEGRAARMGSGRGGWVPACSLAAPPSLQEFVKDAGSYSKKLVDDLLDQITGGDHSRLLFQLRQRRSVPTKPPDEGQVGDPLGDGGSTLDFMAMKSYSDVSLDISVLGCLGKVKKELDHDDGHLSLDETTKLLQDLQEAQVERGGSRPSSNLSSLSNASDRDQHHLGEARLVRSGEALLASVLGSSQRGPTTRTSFFSPQNLQPPRRTSLSFCRETKTFILSPLARGKQPRGGGELSVVMLAALGCSVSVDSPVRPEELEVTHK
ncbi:hypothetical protein E2I00_001235, partial [Balaenoptera physalus]